MFSIRAKQQPIPSISASAPSKFQFYICFQSFQPDFLSVFHDEDTVPSQSLHIYRIFISISHNKHPPSQLPATMSRPNKKHIISVHVVQPRPFDTIALPRTHPQPSETTPHPNRPMKRFKKKTLKQHHKNLNNTTPSPSFHRPNKKTRKQHAPPNFQAED